MAARIKNRRRRYTKLYFSIRPCESGVPRDYPLAFLEVFDYFLFIRYQYSAGLSIPSNVLLDGETYVIHRRAFRRSTRSTHAVQTGHIQNWLRHHRIFPARINGIEIRIHPAPHSISKAVKSWRDKGDVNVYVGSFPDGVKPLWLDDDPSKWSARQLSDPNKRWSNILGSLKEARDTKSEIVVFPELTISPDLRVKIMDWIDDSPGHSFVLILPGSFHEQVNGKTYNIAELCDRFGNPVLHHRKLTRYGTLDKQEGIKTGDRIELLDTPAGLIGIPICRDFCEEGQPFSSLWERLGVEWLLVPSFGYETSVHAHLRRARELFREHETVSIVANQHPEGSNSAHGFVCHSQENPSHSTVGHRIFSVKFDTNNIDK